MQFPTWSLYAQDEWKLSPALTLTWGVRYDQFPSPTYTQGMLNNWDFRTGEWLIGSKRHASGLPRVGQCAVPAG